VSSTQELRWIVCRLEKERERRGERGERERERESVCVRERERAQSAKMSRKKSSKSHLVSIVLYDISLLTCSKAHPSAKAAIPLSVTFRHHLRHTGYL
jgi:hypothetical protein